MSAAAHRHRHAAPATPSASLLRMSAAARLAWVALVVAAIWGGVVWAWS